MKNLNSFRIACVVFFILHIIGSFVYLTSTGYDDDITAPQRVYLNEQLKPAGIPIPFQITGTKVGQDSVKGDFRVYHTYGGKKFDEVGLSEEGLGTVKTIEDSLKNSVARVSKGRFTYLYGRSDLSEEAMQNAGFKTSIDSVDFREVAVNASSSAEGPDSTSLKIGMIDSSNVALALNRANFTKDVILNLLNQSHVDTNNIVKTANGFESQLAPLMADYYSSPQGFDEVIAFNAGGETIQELKDQRYSDVHYMAIMPRNETQSITQPFFLLWLALLSWIFSKISSPRLGVPFTGTREMDILTPARITPAKEKYDWSCLILHIGALITGIVSIYAWANGDMWPAIGLTLISLLLIFRTLIMCYGLDLQERTQLIEPKQKTTYEWIWRKWNFTWITPCLIYNILFIASVVWLLFGETILWVRIIPFAILLILCAWKCWGIFESFEGDNTYPDSEEFNHCIIFHVITIFFTLLTFLGLYFEWMTFLIWMFGLAAVWFLYTTVKSCYTFTKVPTCREFWEARGKVCPCIVISRWFKTLTCCEVLSWIAIISLLLNAYQYFSR